VKNGGSRGVSVIFLANELPEQMPRHTSKVVHPGYFIYLSVTAAAIVVLFAPIIRTCENSLEKSENYS
jgi:hypothetical protein